jgi:hypothetical protein
MAIDASRVEAWQLDVDVPGWLEIIIIKLLAVDVPPTAIGKAFDLDTEPIKELLYDLRVEKYGTAELGEAMHALMWSAYEDMRELLRTAAPSRRLQMNMALLSKASALVGTGTPDSINRMHGELESLYRQVRGSEQTGIYEPDPDDAPSDHSEERLINREVEPQ